ncbi:MAG: hypothetical protein ACI9U2_003267 [Bradymonadia bacterium]|jgi:hypothetical protein
MRRLIAALSLSGLTVSGLALGLAGCGASPEEKKGPDFCEMAAVELKKRLGPEFDKIISGRRLPPMGCAIIYRQVQEEFMGEVAGESNNAFVDQKLAFMLPDGRGKPVLTLIGASDASPGPVLLELKSKELTGDAPAEVVVRETATPDYSGVRAFSYSSAASVPTEIFSTSLKVKTPEGIDIAARWGLGDYKGAKAIILDGAGTKKIFTWNRAAKRFTYNEVATAAVAPKPVAPASTEKTDGLDIKLP